MTLLNMTFLQDVVKPVAYACRSSSRSRSPAPAVSPKTGAVTESTLPPPPKRDAKEDTKTESKADTEAEPRAELRQESKQEAKSAAPVSQAPAVQAEPAAKAASPIAKVTPCSLVSAEETCPGVWCQHPSL